MVDLFDERREYSAQGITCESLDDDPFQVLNVWLAEAVEKQLLDATAMVISTVDHNQKPDSRVVLMKGLKNNQILFFSNYNSVKAEQLDNNPFICANFHWPSLEKQIRIRGRCHKIARIDSEEYFNSRPLASRCAAIASKQSQVVKTRADFENKFNALRNTPQNIQCPEHWGGYAISVDEFEFYKGRENRLNDRIHYILANKQWQKERVAP